VPGRRRNSANEDALAVLGLPVGATAADIVEARRHLAKRAHPDAGGTVESMQRINEAAEAALRAVVEPSGSDRRRSAGRPSNAPARHDHPSFTVEALPVESFEALLIVAAWLGDVISDDPPYQLEVALIDPIRGWCRLDLVPDAGASTVSLSVGAEPGYPVPDLDDVRDLWIDGLNRLDWAHLGPDHPGTLPS
jgi:hypothetical protein